MIGMDLAGLPDWLAGVGALAKEIGKGGGGSTEEPTVCITLLPVAVGVAFVGVQRLRRILRRLEEGRPLRSRPERKVQTAQSKAPGASRGRSAQAGRMDRATET